jgi:hypothetical protein
MQSISRTDKDGGIGMDDDGRTSDAMAGLESIPREKGHLSRASGQDHWLTVDYGGLRIAFY